MEPWDRLRGTVRPPTADLGRGDHARRRRHIDREAVDRVRSNDPSDPRDFRPRFRNAPDRRSRACAARRGTNPRCARAPGARRCRCRQPLLEHPRRCEPLPPHQPVHRDARNGRGDGARFVPRHPLRSTECAARTRRRPRCASAGRLDRAQRTSAVRLPRARRLWSLRFVAQPALGLARYECPSRRLRLGHLAARRRHP